MRDWRRRGCNEIDSRVDAIATLCDEIRHNDIAEASLDMRAIPQEETPFFPWTLGNARGLQPISLIRRFPISVL